MGVAGASCGITELRISLALDSACGALARGTEQSLGRFDERTQGGVVLSLLRLGVVDHFDQFPAAPDTAIRPAQRGRSAASPSGASARSALRSIVDPASGRGVLSLVEEAGLSTSSHHSRKLVGVEFCGVR
jgi:hypothetical protein